MSPNNDVCLMGFCAERPVFLVVYTQELTKSKGPINQVHHGIFFSGKAEMIVKFASTSRHVHLRGSLRSQAKGEGQDRRYHTSILVEKFKESPRQSVEALKDTLREITDEKNITEYNQIGILADVDTRKE